MLYKRSTSATPTTSPSSARPASALPHFLMFMFLFIRFLSFYFNPVPITRPGLFRCRFLLHPFTDNWHPRYWALVVRWCYIGVVVSGPSSMLEVSGSSLWHLIKPSGFRFSSSSPVDFKRGVVVCFSVVVVFSSSTRGPLSLQGALRCRAGWAAALWPQMDGGEFDGKSGRGTPRVCPWSERAAIGRSPDRRGVRWLVSDDRQELREGHLACGLLGSLLSPLLHSQTGNPSGINTWLRNRIIEWETETFSMDMQNRAKRTFNLRRSN